MDITIEEASAIKMIKDSSNSLSTIFAKSNMESLLLKRLESYEEAGLAQEEAKDKLIKWCKNNMSENTIRRLIS